MFAGGAANLATFGGAVIGFAYYLSQRVRVRFVVPRPGSAETGGSSSAVRIDTTAIHNAARFARLQQVLALRDDEEIERLLAQCDRDVVPGVNICPPADYKPQDADGYCIRCEGFAECSARYVRLNRQRPAAEVQPRDSPYRTPTLPDHSPFGSPPALPPSPPLPPPPPRRRRRMRRCFRGPFGVPAFCGAPLAWLARGSLGSPEPPGAAGGPASEMRRFPVWASRRGRDVAVCGVTCAAGHRTAVSALRRRLTAACVRRPRLLARRRRDCEDRGRSCCCGCCFFLGRRRRRLCSGSSQALRRRVDRARAGPGGLLRLPRGLAGALLELASLTLEDQPAATPLFQFASPSVVTAVGAARPPFGVRVLAACTEDGFG